MGYLTDVGELRDENGMASTHLASAVGYPGSSVAFAQLLSGMERSGLIEREVRGKRTYRIGLGPARAARRSVAVNGTAGSAEGYSLAGFDYDELARRLLVQVARHICEPEGQLEGAQETSSGQHEPEDHGAGPPEELLQENVRLREELRDARRSLAQAAERVRRLPVDPDLAGNEVVLLQRLLSPWVRADGDLEIGA
jgi:hypothetical protein